MDVCALTLSSSQTAGTACRPPPDSTPAAGGPGSSVPGSALVLPALCQTCSPRRDQSHAAAIQCPTGRHGTPGTKNTFKRPGTMKHLSQQTSDWAPWNTSQQTSDWAPWNTCHKPATGHHGTPVTTNQRLGTTEHLSQETSDWAPWNTCHKPATEHHGSPVTTNQRLGAMEHLS